MVAPVRYLKSVTFLSLHGIDQVGGFSCLAPRAGAAAERRGGPRRCCACCAGFPTGRGARPEQRRAQGGLSRWVELGARVRRRRAAEAGGGSSLAICRPLLPQAAQLKRPLSLDSGKWDSDLRFNSVPAEPKVYLVGQLARLVG